MKLAVKLFNMAHTLDNLVRCVMYPRNKSQNVAEHSFHISFLALLAFEDVKYGGHGDKLDELSLLKRCLLHDLEEAMVSDVPYPVKNRTSAMKDALAEVTNACWGDALVGYNNSEGGWDIALAAWHHMDGSSFEIGIFKLCDMMEFQAWCWREVAMGNKDKELLKSYGASKEYTVNTLAYLKTTYGLDMPNLTAIHQHISNPENA